MKNKKNIGENVSHAPIVDMRGWPTEIAATLLVAGAAFTLLVGVAGHARAADANATAAHIQVPTATGSIG